MQHQLLKGKRGLVFGAVDERSLATFVARQCLDEGAHLVLTNTENALEIGSLREMAETWNVPVVACDATNVDDLRHLLAEAQTLLGGPLDFVLHSCAVSQNLRRHRDYDHLNYNYYLQTIDASALSLHKLLQTAKEMDAIAEGGSVVTLTYIAANRHLFGYNDMGDAKAMLESIVRNFGSIYGCDKGVRINAVSQSPVKTKASAGFDGMSYFRDFSNGMSSLGNANAQSCAELCVMLFSDYTRFLTMQTIYNDGGFEATALSKKFLDFFRETSMAHLKDE